MNSLVSVIISAYNHEKYIEDCLRSIILQSYENIELLVIDDGSSDATFNKILTLKNECEKRFVRFVFEKQRNMGTRYSGNKLITKSKGKYLFFTASDDVVKPQTVKKLVGFLEQNPEYVLAVGDNEIINENNDRIYWGNKRTIVKKEYAAFKTFGEELGLYTKHYNSFGEYSDLLKSNYIPNGYMIPRSCVLEVGMYDETIYLEDWYLILQLAKLGKFKFFPEILYCYRWHSANTVKSIFFKKNQETFYREIYLKEKEYCFKNGLSKQWKYCWSKRLGLRKKWNLFRQFVGLTK